MQSVHCNLQLISVSVNSYIVLLQGEKGGDGDEGEKGLPGDPVSRHFRFFFFS